MLQLLCPVNEIIDVVHEGGAVNKTASPALNLKVKSSVLSAVAMSQYNGNACFQQKYLCLI